MSMIQLETLSGDIYQQYYTKETDTKYSDIIKYIKIPIYDYPIFNPKLYNNYTIYIEPKIKLLDNSKEIFLDTKINFDTDKIICQIIFDIKYVFYRHLYNTDYVFHYTYIHSTDAHIKIKDYDLSIIKNKLEKNILQACCNTFTARYIPITAITPEVCKLMVSYHGNSLRFIPDYIKTIEICSIAVKNHPPSLEFVPENMKTEELCKISFEDDHTDLKISWSQIKHIPNKFKNKEICNKAINRFCSILEVITAESVIKYKLFILEYIPKELLTKEMCKKVVQNMGYLLKDVPDNMKTEEICRLAVRNYSDSIEFVPIHLQSLFKKN